MNAPEKRGVWEGENAMGARASFSMKSLLVLGVAAIALTANPAAAAPSVRVQIAAQDLGKALNEFARQSGQQLLFSPDLVRGRRAPAVSGTFAPDQALARLLAGTGLTFQATPGGAFVLASATQDAAAPTGGNRPPVHAPETGAVEASNATTPAPTTPVYNTPRDAPRAVRADDDTIVVTGTRIRGAGAGTSPVTTVTREDIQARGFATATDVIRDLPQNFGAQTSALIRRRSGDIAFSDAVDIRGLGADATLTLVNGRRLSPSGGSSGAFFDIGSIATGAIERVEVLTDGASALYGSDAIAGVVNFVLREKFDGLEVRGRADTDGDSQQYLASATAGTSWSTGRILGSLEYSHSTMLRASERDFSRTGDFTDRGGPDLRIPGVGQPPTISALVGPTLPGLGSDVATVRAGVNGRNLTLADFVPGEISFYDVDAFRALVPQADRVAAFASLTQELGGNVEAFADFTYSNRKANFDVEPPLEFFVVPETNPFNPFGEPVLAGYAFINEVGTRRLSAKQEGWSAVVGLQGELDGGRNIGWEVYGIYSRSKADQPNTQIDLAAADAALADPNPETALNVFGNGTANNPQTVQSLLIEQSLTGEADIWSLNAKVDGTLFEFGGGRVLAAIGGEYREESFIADAPFRPAPAEGDRTVTAAYAEVRAPFANDRAEVSGAVRYEDYSDFGTQWSPKVGVRVGPFAGLLLSSTYSRSFKAPLLRELFEPERRIPPVPLFDAATNRRVLARIRTGGNPDLGAEEADTWTVNLNYAPTFAPGARLTLSYFDIDFQNQVLDGINASLATANPEEYPSAIFVRDAAGNLTEVDVRPINAAQTRLRGIDFDLTYAFETYLGRLTAGVDGSYILDYDTRRASGAPSFSQVDTLGFPVDFRGRASVAWTRGIYSANLFVNYTDGYRSVTFGPATEPRRIKSFTTVDLNSAVDFEGRESGALRGLRLGVGVQNLLDEDPPFADVAGGYDSANASPRGRVFYVDLTKRF